MSFFVLGFAAISKLPLVGKKLSFDFVSQDDLWAPRRELGKIFHPLLFRHLLVWKFLKCLECIRFMYFCQNIWRHLCNISPQRYFLEFWSIFSHLVTYITVVWQRCHILFPRPLYIMRVMFPPDRRHDNFGRPSPETQGPWAQSSRWEKHDDHDGDIEEKWRESFATEK